MAPWLRGIARLIQWPAERMERRLFVVFLFLIILPIGALGYFSAQRYTNSIEKNTVTYMSQVSDKMISKLDDYMEDMKKISIIPSYVDQIKDGLKMSNRFYESRSMQDGEGADNAEEGILPNEELILLKIRAQVESSIYFMNNIKSGTNTVYLFDRYGHSYYVLKNESVRSDLNTVYDTWQAAAHKAGGTPVLLSTQEVSGVASSKRYVFTVVREIITTSYETIGMIAVDANIGVIENIVKDLDQATHGTTLIVDDAGRVIFDSEKKYLAQNLSRSDLLRQASGTEGSFHARVDGVPVLTIYKQSPNTGWKVLTTIPEKQLMQDAYRNRNFTLLTSVAIIVFALLISLVLTVALTRPLRSLVRIMREVQNGNMDVMFQVKRRDEIGLVGSAFNRMVARVKALIEDVYMAGQRKQEAELEALQNQINPHFIYNTLEAIRMTAVIHDDTEVSEMAQLLGKLLRYGIGTGSETVPLAREFEHLEMYVTLLNFRYGNKFSLSLPEEPVDLQMPVMKLLFQPIVENAVYHGLDETKPGMKIVISYRTEGPDHVFEVRDDGAGMSPEALAKLRSRLSETAPSSGNGGIGLRNVHERLKLLFGEAYGIGIESELGEGTAVSVRFPLQREKGDGSNG
ncbi:cache domain-containing sensor histidine kinase [Cohnella candidum]|uniref:histidine kinase n=1 Tax=Cohnella candidum TaxID=2674991 RepID=A0A3G3JXX4_9BACL|nr:sensor histidine kinase [Cohnella candidum]AYQ73095.1 sensor histidine kinase [Cohnella candidum]